MARRLAPQISNVTKGHILEFIRTVTDCDAQYLKTRRAYVIEARAEDDLALVAFVRPLRNLFGQQDKTKTFEWQGFKYCRWIKKGKLIDNCKKIRRTDANKRPMRNKI